MAAKLDADGLPENAVEVAAKGMCRMDCRGCCERAGGCYAEEVYSADALGAVSALRKAIREAKQ